MMISGIVGPNKPMVDMVATIDGHMDIHPLLFYIIQKIDTMKVETHETQGATSWTSFA